MRKKFAIILILLIITATLFSFGFNVYATEYNYELFAFVTPYGTSVTIGRLLDPITHLDHPNISNYPNAVKIKDGDNRYNCFTYSIFYEGHIEYLSKATNNEIFTVEEIIQYLYYPNPCCTNVLFSSAQPGEIVIYKTIPSGTQLDPSFSYTYTHAGIVVEKGSTLENTLIESKWGPYAVYRHKIGEDPYSKSATLILSVPEHARPKVQVFFYRFNHTYSYVADTSLTSASVNAKPVTPRSLCHKATCTSCGISHYEIHNFQRQGNYLVCTGCGYVFPTQISDVGDELQ